MGSYEVTYVAIDAAGNVTTPVTRTVLVTDQTAPVISLVGETPLTIAHGSVYTDAGATATDNVDTEVTVEVTNTVDTNTVGSYEVIYAAKDAVGNVAISVTRTVLVTDQTEPVISLVGETPLTIAHGSVYNDAGATATDNVDTEVTVEVTDTVDTNTVGSYEVTYAAIDAAGNVATPVTRTVLVTDQTAPTITLLGESTVTVGYASYYNDEGVSVVDAVDEYLEAEVEGNYVDTYNLGSYTVTYSARDAAGNSAEAISRTVIVADIQAPEIELYGETEVNVTLNTAYIDEGYNAWDDLDYSVEVVVTGEVDTSELGDYELVYSASDNAGNISELTRTVSVIDDRLVLNLPETYYHFSEPSYITEMVVGLAAINHRSGNLERGEIDYYDNDYVISIPSRLVDGAFVNEDEVNSLVLSEDGKSVVIEDLIEMSLSNQTDIEGKAFVHGMDYRQMVMPENAKEYTANYRLIQDLYVLNSQVYDYDLSVGYTSFDELIVNNCENNSAQGFIYLDNGWSVRFNCDDASQQFGELIGYDPLQAYDSTTNEDIGVVVGQWERFILPDSDVEALALSLDSEYQSISEIQRTPIFVVKDGDVWSGYKQNADTPFTESLQYLNDTAYQALLEASASTPPPVIELTGPGEINISRGGIYTEFGATAVDNEGEAVTPVVTGIVDTAINGTYIITYEAQDSEGNVSVPVNRTIYVVENAGPTVFLLGGGYLDIPEGDSFVDPGVTALDGFGQPLPVVVEGTVDTDTIGEYFLNYYVEDEQSNQSSSVYRYVNVTDKTPPVIQLIGDASVTVAHGSTYIDEGVTVTDNVDGDDVYWYSDDYVDTYSVGTSVVTYYAYDYAGNYAEEVTRTVEVVDQTPPEFMVVGEEVQQVTLNTVFTDLGVAPSDNVDDNVEYTVEGEVNTSVAGDYELIYTATDSAGNTAEFTRTVTVVDDRLALNLPETFYKFYVPNYMTEMTLGVDEVSCRSGDLDSGVINYYEDDYVLHIPNRFIGGVFVENDGVQPLLIAEDGKSVIIENLIELSLSNETDIEGTTFKHGNDYRPMTMPAAAKEFTANYRLTQDLYALSSQYYNYDNSVDSYEPYTSFEELISGHCENESVLSEIYLRNSIRVSFDCNDVNAESGDLIGSDPYDSELGTSIVGQWEEIVLPDSDVSALLFIIDPDYLYSNEGDTQHLFTLKDAVVWRGYKQNAGTDFKDSDQYLNEVAYQALLEASASTPPPVIKLIGPSDIYVSRGGAYTEFGATAVDSEGVAVTPVVSGTVDIDTDGTYVITYEAQDSDGNVSIPVERYVYVEDNATSTVFLLGERYIDIPEGGSFVDPGITALDGFGQPLSVVVEGTVDVNTIGEYYLNYYTLDDQGNQSYAEYRYVSVSDKTPPVIQLIGDSTVTVAYGDSYVDQGVTVTDNVDGDDVYWYANEYVDTYNVGTYFVEYYAYDDAGNEAEVIKRTVEVVDQKSPEITLNGEAVQQVSLNTAYVDPGAVVFDVVDDYIDHTVSGEVNTSILGDYELVYSAIDSAGNTATATRTVSVIDDRLALNLPETYYHFSPPAYMTEMVFGVDILSLRSGDLERGIINYYDDSYALNIPDNRLVDGVFSENYYEFEDNSMPLVLSDDGKSVVVEDLVEISISNETDIEGSTWEHGYDYRPMVMPFGAKEYTANYRLTQDIYVLQSQYYGYNYNDGTYGYLTSFNELVSGNCVEGASIDNLSLIDGWTARFNCDDAEQQSGDLVGTDTWDWDSDESSQTIGRWEKVTLPDSNIQAIVLTIDPAYLGSNEVVRSPMFIEQDGQLYEGYKQTAGSALKSSEVYLNDTAYQALLEASASTPPPVIELIGPSDMSISLGGVYTEFGAKAVDVNGVDVTVNESGMIDTSLEGTYVITYEAQDAEGNVSIPVERRVSVVENADPTAFLVGDRNLDVSPGESFVDPGVIVLDGYGQPMTVIVEGEVDTSTPGEYYITYYAEDEQGLYYFEEYRYVYVADSTPPVIELIGDSTVTVAYGGTYVDQGVTVTDNIDGDDVYWDVDDYVDTYNVGTYEVTYYAYDNAGNEALEVVRIVEVVDETPPVITLFGEPTQQVTLNSVYVDAGVEVSDNLDGSIELVKEGSVNTSISGEYILTYTATDGSDNVAMETRTVTVVDVRVAFDLPATLYNYTKPDSVQKLVLSANSIAKKSGVFDSEAGGTINYSPSAMFNMSGRFENGAFVDAAEYDLELSLDSKTLIIDETFSVTQTSSDLSGETYLYGSDPDNDLLTMPSGAKQFDLKVLLLKDIYQIHGQFFSYSELVTTYSSLEGFLSGECEGSSMNWHIGSTNHLQEITFECGQESQASGTLVGRDSTYNNLPDVGTWEIAKLPNSDIEALFVSIDPTFISDTDNASNRQQIFALMDGEVKQAVRWYSEAVLDYEEVYINNIAYDAVLTSEGLHDTQ
nr:immunoglobulin-like domain-containing protein [Leucothrix arctica]